MIQSSFFYLKLVTKDDIELFVEIYTDPMIMEHVGPAFNQETATELFNQCVNQTIKEQPKYLFYVIKNNQNNQKLGIIGLQWNQPESTSVELGVMIAKPYFSRGYAYKVTVLLMRYIFTELKLKSIVLFCNKNNSAANRGVTAMGFQKTNLSEESISNQGVIKWKITSEKYNEIRKKNNTYHK
jgi:RimJ/RimL family protein N-acetyltransferase